MKTPRPHDDVAAPAGTTRSAAEDGATNGETSGAVAPASTATVTPPTGTDRSKVLSLGGLGFKPAHVRLKSLVLDNFKSFASRVQIDLLEGFTAISGPNGSGKSNLIDAMLFVLGFASSKGLRADRLTDLINTESGKPQARVSLELEVTRPSGDLQIVEVSRVVRRVRGTESQAHYELDGEPVRMHDLHDVLHDLGLPSSGLNVVVQNDVTRITALGEVSRRQILDELAGAQEFDKRIGAADRELGEADGHEAEMKIVLGEIETRLKSLEKEKEQALAYQTLTVDRDRLEAELFVLDVLEAQGKAKRKAAEVAGHAERVVELKEEVIQAEAASEGAKAALDAVEAEIAAKSNGERLTVLREVEALRVNVAHGQEQAARARAEAAGIEAGAPARRLALEGAESRERGLAAQEEALKKELESEAEKHASLRREVDLAAAEIHSHAKGTIDAAAIQRSLLRDAEGHRQREAELVVRLRASGDRLARDESERGLVLLGLEGDRARRAEVERQSAEAQSVRRMAREDSAREDERLKKLLQRSQGLRAGIEKADHDAAVANADLSRADERRRVALEHSGGRGLAAIRRENLPGIHGAVHELMKFDADYALAIQVASGARLNWVVVDDEQTGKRAIEVLRRANAGRLTFSPLSKFRAPNVDLKPVRGAGVVGYALELVEFDGAYDAVLRAVLTDTLIVESMESALALGLGRYRMVTLDGELLDRNGNMTGGDAGAAASQFALAAKLEQEIEKRQAALEEIRRRRDAARQELEAVDAEGRAAQAGAAARQAKLSDANAQAEQLSQELARLEQRIAPAEARLAQLDAALTRARAENAAAESELQAVREILAGMDARLRDLPAAGQGAFELLTGKNEHLEQDMRALERGMEKRRETLGSVQVERRGALAEVETARRAIEDARQALEAALARAEVATAEAARLAAELAKKEKTIAALMEELRELNERREEAKANAQDMRDGAKEVARLLDTEQKAQAEAERLFAELDAQAKALAALAADKKLVLPPVIDDTVESSAGTSDKSGGRRRARAEAAEAAVQDPNAFRASEVGKRREQARRELAKTEGKMKALEPVNMLAITQFTEFAQRKAELDERLATLDREVSAIRARIVELEGAKKTSFLQAFDAVAVTFREVFHELTGGEGWLELSNKESPFDGGLTIVARPKNQKAARLESLSGGEKTLTALAFLFALQKVNPAPFFVFDEVDASLDGVNTGKLADAIRRRGDERQYFVVSHRRALVEKAHQAIGVTKRKGLGTMVAGITLEEVSAVEALIESERREKERRETERKAKSGKPARPESADLASARPESADLASARPEPAEAPAGPTETSAEGPRPVAAPPAAPRPRGSRPSRN